MAEDLVQDCLSAAWQRLESFDGRSSLSTWLLGIMKLKVIDHFRKSKRTPTDQAFHAADEDDAGQHLPPAPLTYQVMQAVVCPILKVLGLCCRSAFNLCSEQMDRELTKRESLRLRVHLPMCGLCSLCPPSSKACGS